MRLSVIFVVFMVACAGARSAPPIDREPTPRATEALPADATHEAETAPKRETTPTSAAPADKGAPKDATILRWVGFLQLELRHYEAARDPLEQAVTLDDELDYDEPEPLPFPARHWLGAALIEAKRFSDAETVYKKDLEQHPHNGWSLLGLQQALKGQGKTDAAVDADLAKSWSRSDTWIKASRF